MHEPQTITEITALWLTRALRSGGSVREAAVTGVKLRPIGEGAGYVSSMVRAELDYDLPDSGGPRSVVIKLPTGDAENRAFGESVVAFEREIRFYQEVAPVSSLRVPRCYYSSFDPQTHVYVLVLEDLSGKQVGDQVVGLTRAQILMAVDAIAPFHARWWGGDPARLPWVPGGASEFARQKATTADYQAAWPRFLAEFGQHASAQELAIGERLGESVDAVARALEQRPQTLAHADYRADNFFFDQGDSDAPMVVLDWQLAMWTAGSYDIAYLVGGSLPAADRVGLHDEVVRRWHGHLTANGVNDYTVEQAWDDYRLGMVLALTTLVTFSHALATGGARGQALGAVLTERLFGALAECAIDPASLPF